MLTQHRVFDSFSLKGQWVQLWLATGQFTYDTELTGWLGNDTASQM